MGSAPATDDSAWKVLYTAALFEDDDTRVPAVIARAETEIAARVDMLFDASGDNAGELQALDKALHMLQALKTCLQVGPVDTEAA